jgi:hypothetical protein
MRGAPAQPVEEITLAETLAKKRRRFYEGLETAGTTVALFAQPPEPRNRTKKEQEAMLRTPPGLVDEGTYKLLINTTTPSSTPHEVVIPTKIDHTRNLIDVDLAGIDQKDQLAIMAKTLQESLLRSRIITLRSKPAGSETALAQALISIAATIPQTAASGSLPALYGLDPANKQDQTLLRELAKQLFILPDNEHAKTMMCAMLNNGVLPSAAAVSSKATAYLEKMITIVIHENAIRKAISNKELTIQTTIAPNPKDTEIQARALINVLAETPDSITTLAGLNLSLPNHQNFLRELAKQIAVHPEAQKLTQKFAQLLQMHPETKAYFQSMQSVITFETQIIDQLKKGQTEITLASGQVNDEVVEAIINVLAEHPELSFTLKGLNASEPKDRKFLKILAESVSTMTASPDIPRKTLALLTGPERQYFERMCELVTRENTLRSRIENGVLSLSSGVAGAGAGAATASADELTAEMAETLVSILAETPNAINTLQGLKSAENYKRFLPLLMVQIELLADNVLKVEITQAIINMLKENKPAQDFFKTLQKRHEYVLELQRQLKVDGKKEFTLTRNHLNQEMAEILINMLKHDNNAINALRGLDAKNPDHQKFLRILAKTVAQLPETSTSAAAAATNPRDQVNNALLKALGGATSEIGKAFTRATQISTYETEIITSPTRGNLNQLSNTLEAEADHADAALRSEAIANIFIEHPNLIKKINGIDCTTPRTREFLKILAEKIASHPNRQEISDKILAALDNQAAKDLFNTYKYKLMLLNEGGIRNKTLALPPALYSFDLNSTETQTTLTAFANAIIMILAENPTAITGFANLAHNQPIGEKFLKILAQRVAAVPETHRTTIVTNIRAALTKNSGTHSTAILRIFNDEYTRSPGSLRRPGLAAPTDAAAPAAAVPGAPAATFTGGAPGGGATGDTPDHGT